MKTKQIAGLQEKDTLDNEPFLLRDVVRRRTKNGNPYALCVFSDTSGQMNGVFWDIPDDVDVWLRPGIAVLVTGEVTNYRDGLQIRATNLSLWSDPDMSLFLPSSPRPREEMIAELREHIANLQAPWGPLVGHVLLSDDFLSDFAGAPAARMMHHAYVGGLLEHTLSMATLAVTMAAHYPYVNKDLLLAGVLLHDAGKAQEYDVDTGFSFSDDGRLVGHILRAVVMVEKAAAELGNIPPADLRQLVHLIASHHGTHEWGSPVVPKTLEAILLHQIDLLDSRIQGFYDHLRNDNSEGDWSTRSSHMFNTELRRPAGFLDEEE